MIRPYILLVLLIFAPAGNAAKMCTYQAYPWDSIAKKAVNHLTVNKPYNELTAAEIHVYTGCSVCQQDQRIINIPPLMPFKVCHVIANRLRNTLERLLKQGEPVRNITGYRVGKTRGEADENGIRTSSAIMPSALLSI